MTKQFFLTSLEIEFELCNLRCQYCWLTLGNLETIRKGEKIYSRQKGERSKYDYSLTDLTTNIRSILAKCNSHLLKVSGGEIFLLPEVIDEILLSTHKFDRILFVSNGTVLDQYCIEKLDPQVFSFQISLDGHIDVANKLRFKEHTGYTQKILDSLEKLLDFGFICEISCVLTDHNIHHLLEFCAYIEKYFPKVTIFPFPVRFSNMSLKNAPETIYILKQARDRFCLSSLPPRAYMDALIDTINGHKSNTCYLPILGLYGCEDGTRPLCPCGVVDELPNIITSDFTAPPERSLLSVENVLNRREPKCSDCFTHFDLINLFLEGKISENDLVSSGIFQDRLLRSELTSFKQKLLN